VRLLRATLPDRPAVDAALGPALLERARSRPAAEPVLHVSRPAPTVGFGRLDRIRPGFAAAVRAARAHGFEPVVRAPGGHAAAYHHGSVVLEIVAADPDPVAGLRRRFAWAAEALAAALRAVGADARIGPVHGEYCSGEYTVNGAGRVKLAGVAQRLRRDAWMLGAEIVVEDGAPVRRVLTEVYAALALEFAPATAAAVEELAPGSTVDAVERAVLEAFGVTGRLALDPALVREAEALAAAAAPPG
jgi:lipoate-protein ligase A